MKKTKFSNWWEVFKFTFKQGTRSTKFKGVTAFVALAMLALGIIVNLLMAQSQLEELDVSSIEKVYIVNSSDLPAINTDGFLLQNEEFYPDLVFETTSDSLEQVTKNVKVVSEEDKKEHTNDVILEVVKEEKTYVVKVIIPEGSEVTEEEADILGSDFAMTVQQSKMLSLDIPIENQVMALSEVLISHIDAGEAVESEDETMFKILMPLLLMMIIYFMNLVYGQSMGNIVSVEKSSKLVEYLLTITNSYSLIFGKITATASIAIIQIVTWLGSLVGGFFIGDILATQMVNSNYNNEILQIIELIKGQEGNTAFTLGATILAIMTLCIGMLFYFMIAGMVSSFVSKADELQNVMSIHQMIVVMGFFGGYLVPLFEDETLNMLLRIIPFTSAYMLPGDIMVGNVTALEGVLYTLILAAFSAVVVYFTGKIYKKQLFNRGKEGKLQKFFNKFS